jgi:NAD(P)-dependent dehydrogenase (short-subunit alcohol dehydrogenase family)
MDKQTTTAAAAGDRPWKLDGRVAIVTGASSGIGRAAAALLAERGARVMAVARDEARLATLRERTGVETLAISIDRPEACAKVVEETRRRLGAVGILVNNAGRGSDVHQPIWDESRDNWREMMAVNLDAPFDLTRLAARDMRDLGWGRVIMVSSTAGQVGAPAMSPYCASKHGLLGLMRAAAHDLAKIGATCNAVLPGWVRTEMAERDAERESKQRGVTTDQVWAERAAGYPTGRVLEAEDIARAIAFLASEDASAINGEAITISHGSLW